MKRNETVKLRTIRYKTTLLGNLAGFQMEFGNLTGSPLFEGKQVYMLERALNLLQRSPGVQLSPFKMITIDESRTISKVSLKVCNSCIGGLRFIDEDG